MPELPLITIDRFIRETFGTYGSLALGDFRCFTVEPPWLGNCPWKSCIPDGLYMCHRDEFSSGRPPYPDLRFEAVPGRTDVELHALNLPSESDACIGVAEMLKWQGPIIRGVNSKHTLSALLQVFDTDDIHVLIR